MSEPHKFMARVFLTKNQQLQLCLKREQAASWSLRDLMLWAKEEFRLPQVPGKATLSRILRTKATLQAMWPDCRRMKRMRSRHMVLLDTRVVEAVALVERGNVALTGSAIIALARVCAVELCIPTNQQPKFTRSGWLRHFLARHGLKHRRAHGESDAVDHADAETAVRVLRTLIRNYHPSDVFNMDEAAYFQGLSTIVHLHQLSSCAEAAQGTSHDRCRDKRIGHREAATHDPGDFLSPALFPPKATDCAVCRHGQRLDDGTRFLSVAAAAE